MHHSVWLIIYVRTVAVTDYGPKADSCCSSRSTCNSYNYANHTHQCTTRSKAVAT